jgi:hypothetical protein
MNELRLMPRFLTLACYVGYGILCYAAWNWFVAYDFNALENEAVALAVIGFPSVILSALAGVVGGITKAYFNTPKTYGDGNGD